MTEMDAQERAHILVSRQIAAGGLDTREKLAAEQIRQAEQAARVKALEEARGAQCYRCGVGEPVRLLLANEGGGYVHVTPEGAISASCDAGAIRALKET